MRRKWKILAAAIVLAALGWLGWRLTHRPPQYMTLTGIVDGRVVVVSSQIIGRIVKMNVHTGSQVKAGQLLAILQQNELSATVAGASAAAAAAVQQYRTGEEQLRLLAASLPAQIAQAHAQMRQAEAQVAQARANLAQVSANTRRIRPLARAGIVSRQQLDEAVAQQAAAQAALAGARRSLAAARAALANARAQRLQLQMQQRRQDQLRAAIRQARANRRLAQAQYQQTELLAPVAGIVNLRVAYPGEVVSPASPIVTIYDLKRTWVDAYLPETEADQVTLGEQVRVRLPSGRILPGKIYYKSTEAGFATQRDVSRAKRDIRTVALRVRVANPRGELALGMTCWVLARLRQAAPAADGAAR